MSLVAIQPRLLGLVLCIHGTQTLWCAKQFGLNVLMRRRVLVRHSVALIFWPLSRSTNANDRLCRCDNMILLIRDRCPGNGAGTVDCASPVHRTVVDRAAEKEKRFERAIGSSTEKTSRGPAATFRLGCDRLPHVTVKPFLCTGTSLSRVERPQWPAVSTRVLTGCGLPIWTGPWATVPYSGRLSVHIDMILHEWTSVPSPPTTWPATILTRYGGGHD